MDNAYDIAIPPPQPPCVTATRFLDDDAANAALGFRFVRALAVERAALDPTLPKACTFVLAAITYHMKCADFVNGLGRASEQSRRSRVTAKIRLNERS